MRSKITVVLLFLNVVLFYYIFHYEKALLQERAIMEARKKVYGPEVATIDSLTRTNRSGQTLKIERRGESWMLTQPYEWPADRNAVDRMINELQFLEHETSFSVEDLGKSGQTLAEYGLENPAYTITFTSGGKTYVSKVGDNTEIANRLYLLSPDGKHIHVVSRSLADSIGLPLEVVRSPAVFSIPVFEVRSVTIQNSLKVRLQRDANTNWNFEAPIRARASKGKVEVTINALNSLAAKNFPELNATDMERTGLNAPSLRITLEGNLRKETLLIGNPVPPKTNAATNATAKADGTAPEQEYFAKIEDKTVVFTVSIPQSLLDDLRSAQEKLRDPHVLDFDPATVTAVSITAPNETGLTLQQLVPGTAPWQVVVRIDGQAPLTIPADSGIVDELLQKLHLLTKTEFLSDAPSASDLERYGFNRPDREISLSLSTGGGPRGSDPSTLTLQIGVSPDQPGKAFARVTTLPFIYQIVPDILDATPVLARHYRQRTLRTLPDGARIQGLSLTEKATGTPIYVKQLDEAQSTWDKAVASESEPRRKAIGTILTQLHTLRAKEFTADIFSPDHAETPQGPRPWKYRLDLNFSFAGGNGPGQNPTSTLFLTDRLGGNTQVAGTAEFGGAVFEITQDLLDALFTLIYREKNDPGVPSETESEPTNGNPAPETSSPVEPAVSKP